MAFAALPSLIWTRSGKENHRSVEFPRLVGSVPVNAITNRKESHMTTRELSGTTAVVTGASRGFGRSIAIALSQAGAQVVGVARQAGEAILALAVGQGGGQGRDGDRDTDAYLLTAAGLSPLQ
jgi:hypothetical protein